jgi:hypothetical protein
MLVWIFVDAVDFSASDSEHFAACWRLDVDTFMTR